MRHDLQRSPGRSTRVEAANHDYQRPTPGKTTLVQLMASGGDFQGRPTGAEALDIAAQGTAGGGSALPHFARIQAAFGRHDVSGVSSHMGAEASAATRALGAEAYASRNRVAFASGSPSLHTAAHEAAHVVQQRAGVQLKGGVGESGDRYEQHADAVADAVVAGGSAESLLDQMAGGGGGGAAVQREDKPGDAGGGGDADPGLAILTAGEQAITEGRTKFHWTPDHSTDGRARALSFDDPALEALLDYLIKNWDGSPELRLEVGDANSGVPLFLSKFREHALNSRSAPLSKAAKLKAKMPEESELKIHQAQAARKLCDAVAPQTDAEKFRQSVVDQADKTIGKVVVSGDSIAETRHPTKLNKDGVLPKAMPNYTSCIDTAGNEIGAAKIDKGAKRPTLPGIGDLGFASSPAFNKFTPGSTARPRVGDFAIYAKDKNGQPNFQHIDVVRRIDPAGEDGHETWYTVDGGQESTTSDAAVPTAESSAKFDPATGQLGAAHILYGWLDVEKLYSEAQKPKAKP